MDLGTNSGESDVRNLEAESIKSRAESMGGCVKLKTTCVRKVLLYEKGAGCSVCSQQSQSRQSVGRERGSTVCWTQDLNCLTRIARQVTTTQKNSWHVHCPSLFILPLTTDVIHY